LRSLGGTLSPPVLAGTTAAVVTGDGNVNAVAYGGPHPSVAWTIPIGSPSFGSPATDGAGHVVTTEGKSLVAVQDHGATRWVARSQSLHGDAVARQSPRMVRTYSV